MYSKGRRGYQQLISSDSRLTFDDTKFGIVLGALICEKEKSFRNDNIYSLCTLHKIHNTINISFILFPSYLGSKICSIMSHRR